MKKTSNLLVLSVLSLFIIASCNSGKNYESVKVKTREDSVSYFLGLTYGSGSLLFRLT
jgi:hypothetical protein